VPVIDPDGLLTGVIEIIRDITAHRRLEEQFRQAQKMESIGTLAGGIAHDFNNLLSAILGYGEMALEELAADHPACKSVHTIMEAGRRASHLTRDLLMFSRKQTSQKEPVDVNVLITRIEKFIRRVIGEDIQFETRLAKEPLVVFADSHQVDQVLMNFATNARDAMPAGGYLSISTERLECDQDFIDAHGFGRPGSYVRIAVADTGKGMDTPTAAKIFDPFFTTKELGKGTGLGLAVVYGIVMDHQGHINVYSEPGNGAVFTVYLPLIEERHETKPREIASEQPQGGKETILLAEDDWTVRQLFARVLEQAGYRVLTAINGAEAVRVFQENREAIDLLVFDLIMPKMNGKQALEAIQQVQPEVRGIFVSGYAPENVQHKDLLDVHMEVLYKPVSPKELLRTVREILDTP
jgi:nitrogen-specific signal transduction histidine kinase